NSMAKNLDKHRKGAGEVSLQRGRDISFQVPERQRRIDIKQQLPKSCRVAVRKPRRGFDTLCEYEPQANFGAVSQRRRWHHGHKWHHLCQRVWATQSLASRT